jgi:hypothetical protein
MIAFIDDNRDVYEVEPICRVLPIAPSTYHERVAQRQNPVRVSAWARRDVALKPEIDRVFAENFAAYGVRKVWRQMMREGFAVARYRRTVYARDELGRGNPWQAGTDDHQQ